MSETTLVHIPDRDLPVWNDLSAAVMKRVGSDQATLRHFGLDSAALKAPSDQTGMDIKRNGEYSRRTQLDAWVDRLIELDGAQPLWAYYRRPLELPAEPLRNRAWVPHRERHDESGTETGALFFNTASHAATLQFFGIDVSEWEWWASTSGHIGRRAHLIYVIQRIAAAQDVTFGPVQYRDLYTALRDSNQIGKGNTSEFNEVLQPKQAKRYIDATVYLRKQGVETVEDLGSWIADDWDLDTVIMFNGLGIKHVQVKQLWDRGLHSGRAIKRVLTGEVPFEWAMDAQAAREEAVR